MSLRDAVNSCDQLTSCDCARRSSCQPTNDLLVIKVLDSLVVRESDECLEDRGCLICIWNSVKIVSEFLSPDISFYLLFSHNSS